MLPKHARFVQVMAAEGAGMAKYTILAPFVVVPGLFLWRR